MGELQLKLGIKNYKRLVLRKCYEQAGVPLDEQYLESLTQIQLASEIRRMRRDYVL